MISRRAINFLLLATVVTLKGFTQSKDSLTIYEKLKNAADKSEFTLWLYRSFFVDPKPKDYPVQPVSVEEKIVNPYLKYENKIIRNIHIKIYDPFGYLDKNTSGLDFFQRSGNRLHIKTKSWVIERRFLFDINDSLDPLTLSETERLLRQESYINDAGISVAETTSSDSVDVNVTVYDKWPFIAPVVLSGVSGRITFRNQNFFGLGHQFQQYVEITKQNKSYFSGFYNIGNIRGTFISSTLFYEANQEGTLVGASAEQPLYSPLAKWGGGISANRKWKSYNYKYPGSETENTFPLNSWAYDIWLSKSTKLNSLRKYFNNSTNIIVGGRYYENIFDKRPPQSVDTGGVNSNTAAFIGSIGVSVQQFYKDKFIYRFGINEDIPQGVIFVFTYGVKKTESLRPIFYSGLEIARARRFSLGYFSNSLSAGVFLNKEILNDITVKYRLNYFSDLRSVDGWYWREFINYEIIYGEKRSMFGQLTITQNDLYGFDAGNLRGDSKMLLNLETVAYAPYNIVGFKFAPVLSMGFGTLYRQTNYLDTKLFQAYSIGLMFRNENLLNSTFQISLGMYPYLPENKNYTFKYNPIASFTLKVRAFSVTKPAFISY